MVMTHGSDLRTLPCGACETGATGSSSIAASSFSYTTRVIQFLASVVEPVSACFTMPEKSTPELWPAAIASSFLSSCPSVSRDGLARVYLCGHKRRRREAPIFSCLAEASLRRESCVQRFWSRRSGETSLPICNARVCRASVVAPLLTTRVFRRELRYDVADSAAATTFARIAALGRTVSSSAAFLFHPFPALT